jgi:hypothetical protein
MAVFLCPRLNLEYKKNRRKLLCGGYIKMLKINVILHLVSVE